MLEVAASLPLPFRPHAACTPCNGLSPSTSVHRSTMMRWRRPPLRTHIYTRIKSACDVGGSNGTEAEEIAAGSGGGVVQRYLFAVEYIGTRFSGSQWQHGRRTVVGVLQDAFQLFLGQSVSVVCSSRTDTGVHAVSNACHVDIKRTSKRKPGDVLQPHDPAIVRRAVNHFLQKNEGDITITDIRCVPLDFHARFMAVERTYAYVILTGVGPLSLFDRGRTWHVAQVLDILAMQKACDILEGSHDFSSFRGSRCQASSPIKTLDELCVTEVEPWAYHPSSMWRFLDSPTPTVTYSYNTVMDRSQDAPQSYHITTSGMEFGQRRKHGCLVIKARARSFLYHQVRLLVGMLKSVGAGDLTPKDVERILHARTVTAAQPMAPACGLYLSHVKYDLP